MIARAVGILSIVVACLIACSTTTAADVAVQDLVNQVSQAVYTDYLNNLLYTHTGDNRSVKGGPQHDPAAQNIFVTFRRYGLTTMYDPFTWTSGGTTYNCKNVIAIKQGVTNPDQIYVFGGHYDSTANAGADDDASGVAGVLEAARVMSRYDFNSTVIFAAFDNEENGLFGSAHMAADYASRNILGMIDADMIAWNMPSMPNQALLYGNSPTMKAALTTAVSQFGNGLTCSDAGDWTASDHHSFEDRGFQVCWMYEAQKQGNTSIHGPNDTVDTPGYIDYTYATNMTRCFVGYLSGAAGIVGEASASVPEPGGMAALAIGLCCLAGIARLRRPARRSWCA